MWQLSVAVLVIMMAMAAAQHENLESVDDAWKDFRETFPTANPFFAGDQPDNPGQPFNPPPGSPGSGGSNQPFTGTCKQKLEIVLVLDHSGSIRFEKAWVKILNFTIAIINHVIVDPKEGARVALITFDDRATLMFDLDRYDNSKDIEAAIRAIPRPGQRFNTSMRAGLEQVGPALSRGRSKDTRFVAILISDGLPKDDTASNIIKLGERLKNGDFTGNEKVELFTVGVLPTPRKDREQMRQLLSELADKDTHYHSVDDFDRLGSILTALVNDTCPYNNAIPGEDLICEASSDLYIIIDGSGSITDNNPADNSYDNWELVKTFLRLLVGRLGQIGPTSTQVGIIVFGNNAKIITHLNEDNSLDGLLRVINGLESKNQNTNTSGALRLMVRDGFTAQRGDRVGVQNIALILTDGVSTYAQTDTIPSAQAARRLGVRILALGITNMIDRDELKGLSSPPQRLGEQYWITPSFQTLNSVLSVTLAQTCRPLPKCRRADVAVVLDSSGSIDYKGPENWQLELEFTRNILKTFSISEDNTRVGYIRFATDSQVIFNLTTYNTGEAVDAAVSRIQYTGGRTEIGKALRRALDELFTPAGGDRPDVPNIIILLTDGEETSETVLGTNVAKEAHARGIEIFVVGVTNKVNLTQLRNIASDPDSTHVYQAADYTRLASILEDVIPNTCGPKDTVIDQGQSPTPAPVIPVRPDIFTPAPPVLGLSCRFPPDIVFVMDLSGGRIRERSFGIAKDFMKRIVMNNMDIRHPDGTRFGVLISSDFAEIVIPLRNYNDLDSLASKINDLPFKQAQNYNIPDALKLLYSDVFVPSDKGDRLNHPNIAVFITDGGGRRSLRTDTYQAAVEAKKRGIHIVVVAIGNLEERNELAAIASYPQETNVIKVRDYNELASYEGQLVDFLCNNINECSSNPCFNGGICFDNLGSYSCLCSEKYGGINCEYFCREPSDLVLSLDVSGSIYENNFYRLLDFFREVVEELPVGSGMRLGLQTFSENVTTYFYLNTYDNKLQILNAWTLPYINNGGTNTAAAISNLRNSMFTQVHGDRSNIPNIAVVTTDGRSDDREAAWQQALLERLSGTHNIAVGIGRNVVIPELTDIASHFTGANVITSDSFSTLNSVKTKLVETICNRVDECESNPCQNGGTCIDERGGYTCECNDQTTGLNCERACSGVMDLVLVADVSGSIRYNTFKEVQKEMINIIMKLEIGSNKVSVGLLTFDDEASLVFPFRLYNSKPDIAQAISRAKYSGNKTDVAGALYTLRTEMFDPGLGARGSDVPKVAIIFTDGTQTTGSRSITQEASEAKLAGIHVITVSVGSGIDMKTINSIASYPPSRNVFRARRLSALPGVIQRIPQALCNDQDECSSNPCQNNGRCADRLGSYECHCPRGFTGENCEREVSAECRSQTRDIAFLIDVRDGDSRMSDPLRRAFIRAFLFGLDLESGGVRVSAAIYGRDTQVLYDFNTHDNARDAVKATTYPQDKTETNTAGAYAKYLNEILNGPTDRPNVRNAVVLLTDGGGDRAAADRAKDEAAKLKQQGTMVYVVAFGQYMSMSQASDMASPVPDNSLQRNVVQFRTEADAYTAATSLLTMLCSS